jgi:hypothetical protein
MGTMLYLFVPAGVLGMVIVNAVVLIFMRVREL